MATLARYGDSSLPALVLLHGLLGTKADWLPLLPRLSQHFHCVCLDLPGHGEHQPALTEADMVAGFDFCVQDILARLDALHLSQFHLYGYSLGGRIALQLAKAYPERLNSLLLESCHPGLTSAKERAARAENDAMWAERLVKLPTQDFLTLWYQQPVFADMSPEQRQRTIAMRQSMLDSHPQTALKAIYLATSLAAQAPLWQVP
ncbi:MAG: alpha/beta fold hydrolase, partial [Shewanella sp.]